MSDLAEALKYASNLFQRGMLGIAATLYAIFVMLAPSVNGSESLVIMAATDAGILDCHAVLLTVGQRSAVTLIFAIDAALIFWRLFDPKPRIWWARIINFSTACLWTTVTGITLYTYRWPLPEAVGEIMLTIVSLYTLTRTDYSDRDRRVA